MFLLETAALAFARVIQMGYPFAYTR